MRILLPLAICLAASTATDAIAVEGSDGSATRTSEQAVKQGLDETYLAWHQGLSSPEQKMRRDTLRSMLPTKQDVAYLFPEHADKLWPRLEQVNQFLIANVDRLAQQMTGGGDITRVEAVDVRNENANSPGAYAPLLAIIPDDVDVFRIVVHRTKRTSGSSTYLYLHGRWIWIKGLEMFPAIL